MEEKYKKIQKKRKKKKSGFRLCNSFSHKHQTCISISSTEQQPSQPGWCLSPWYSYLPNNNPKEHSLPGHKPDHIHAASAFFFFSSVLSFVRHGNIDSDKFRLFRGTDWLRFLFCCWGNHDWGVWGVETEGKTCILLSCVLYFLLSGNSEKGSDLVAVSCVGSDFISSTCLMGVLFKTARTMIRKQMSTNLWVLQGQMKNTCAGHQ